MINTDIATKPTKESDAQQASLAQISSRLSELRNQATAPGLNGDEKDRIAEAILRLEVEHNSVVISVADDKTSESERQKAIKLAEELEAKGDPKSLEMAANIRKSIMQTEYADSQKVEEHSKLAQRGIDQLAATKKKIADDQAERDQERADAEAADLKRQQA